MKKFYDDDGGLFAEVSDDGEVKLHHTVTDTYTKFAFIKHTSMMSKVRRYVLYLMFPGPYCTECGLPGDERYYVCVVDGTPDPGLWRCPSGHVFLPKTVDQILSEDTE